MTELKRRIHEIVEKNQDELVQLVMDLVRHPSVKGNELSAQKFFAEKLTDLGAIVDLFEPDINKLKDNPEFVTNRDSFEGSPVIGSVIKGSGSGKSLILCGHMDVVDPGSGAWTYGPFDPQVKDGKIYGRGTVDMKGGIACSYFAVKALQEAGVKLKGDVKILTTIDEEVGNCGMLALVDKGYTADGAIVTEPSDLALTLSSSGSVWYKLRVFGKAAHGGSSYYGVNAIYKAIPFITRIREWEEERRLKLFCKDEHYKELPIPFCVGVNKFHAGTMPAVVPEEAVLEGRIGISPSETNQEVTSEFIDMIERVAASDPWTSQNPPSIEILPSRWISRTISSDHPLVESVKDNFALLFGKQPKIDGMIACSDSGTLQKIGKTPAFEFGPGPMTTLHKTDEYVLIDSLINTTKIIASTLIDWCELDSISEE